MKTEMKLKNLLKVARNTQAFTLTELLIVIAILGILATFVGGTVINKFNRAKVDSTKIQIKNLGVVLDDFRRECGFYPTTDQGLDALIHKPTTGRECKSYDPEGYMKNKAVPKDSWNNDFMYESDGNKYVIKSLGADGKEAGEDLDKDLSSEDT